MIIKTEKITPAMAAPRGAARGRGRRSVGLLSTIFCRHGSNEPRSSEFSAGAILRYFARPSKAVFIRGLENGVHYYPCFATKLSDPRDAPSLLLPRKSLPGRWCNVRGSPRPP
jgi:hypothetical protein